MTDKVNRRDLLTGAVGAAAGASLVSARAIAQDTPAPAATLDAPPPTTPTVPPQGETALFFFNEPEARFVEAAVERLIPADSEWPGAAFAGVLFFIDRQLASDWGSGYRMYLNGPWDPMAPPEQGYQLRYPPAELYRIAIGEIRRHVADSYGGREFWDMTGEIQDEVLKGVETGSIELPTIPGPVFFETLLANTIEGFFADPAYGGNRDMVGWRMVGFPGAYATYVDLVDRYDIEYRREPISFANTAARKAHIVDQH